MMRLTYQKPEIKNSPRTFPDSCFLAVTPACNLKCHFCYSHAGKKPFLPCLEEILGILKILKENGIVEIKLTGGEFLSVKYWEDVLDAAGEMEFLTSIVSNGTLIEKISRDSLKKIFTIGISVHSSDPGVYEKMTGVKGSFARMIQGLKTLKQNDIPAGLMFTVTADNYGHFYKTIYDLTHKHKVPVKGVHINRVIETGSAKDCWQEISGVNYRVLFEQIVRVREELKVPVSMHPFPLCRIPAEYHGMTGPCGAGRCFFVVDGNGDIRLCPMDQRIAGNILKQPLEEIFASSFWKNFCDYGWLPGECRDCGFFDKKCTGGCYMSSKQPVMETTAPDILIREAQICGAGK